MLAMYAFDWSPIPRALPHLWVGMKVTLQITLTAMIVGIALGTVLAMMRLSKSRLLSMLSAGYVNLFRAVPLIMVLLWFFLIVPTLIERLFSLSRTADTRVTSALVAFSLFQAAYYAEIIRAGIQSVKAGQVGAALALGMTFGQAMRLVVLPQAFRNMTPLLLTQTIILFQDTSLVYVSAVPDFFGVANIVGTRDGRQVEMILFAGAIYFAASFVLSSLVKRYQNRLKVAA
jgi:glutamate/aspartate transport system permease protein